MEKLGALVDKTIEVMPAKFTTHELVICLAKNNQHEYIEMLYSLLGSKTPFQELHSKIGKYLSKSSKSVNRENGAEKVDVDIFGQFSSNAEWTNLLK